MRSPNGWLLTLLLRVLGAPILAALVFLALVVGYAALPDDQDPGGRGSPKTTGADGPTTPTLLDIPGKPIPAYTPGTVNPAIGVGQLCPHLSVEWAEARRTLGTTERRLTLARYGIGNPETVSEWDHLVPRELGGADTIANIWPQTNRAQDQRKDQLENSLHRAVCGGQLNLSVAQQRARNYWEWW